MRTLLAALLLAVLPPVSPVQITAPFVAPTGPYGAGHRGMDLAARPDQLVTSPMTGIVTFSGSVAGKDVVTITDGARVVSLEPVVGVVQLGAVVHAHQVVGVVGLGGHCTGKCVHIGLRINGAYVAPLRVHARLVP